MPLTTKPPTCEGCPAYHYGIGFVPPDVPKRPRYAWVGQGPGESEAYSSRPFHPEAPAGSLATKWVHRAGGQRTDGSWGNIVQCWLPEKKVGRRGVGNRYPTLAETRWCWNAHSGPWLYALAKRGVEWFIPVGGPAIKWLYGIPWDKGAEKYAGTLVKTELPPLGENT